MAKRTPKPVRKGSFQETVRKLGDLFVWLLIAVAPLVVVLTAENPFRLPKLLVSEWLGLASLTAYALAAAVERTPRAAPSWRSPAVLAIVPMVVAASLGLGIGEHPVLVRSALIDLWIGAACLVGWSLAVDSARLERFVRGLALPAVLMASFGILQFHGAFRPFQFTRGEEAFRTGVTALAGNAGDLGAFLVLPAVVAQWGVARAASGRARALWAGALAITVYGVVATQTLTALGALLVASVAFQLLRLPARRAVALLAAGVVAAGLVTVAVPPLRERVAAVTGRLAEGEWNAALTGRLDGWLAAAWMFGEHPVAGVGHGAYRAEFGPAKLALQESGVEFFPGHTDPYFANAHNDLLEAAAEWGILGVVALLWALAFLASTLGRWRRAGDRRVDDRWALAIAGVAGGVVLSLGHFPFHLALVAYPYLLFLAWVFRRAEAAEEEEGAPPAAAGSFGARAAPWLLAIALALALLAHTGRSRDRVSASKQLRVVKVVSEEMARTGRVSDQLVSGNFRLLREAERDDPSEIGVPVAIGGQYMLLERYEQAIDVYREALAQEPRPEIHLNLGRALLAAGREEDAWEAFEKAVRLAPDLRRELPPGVVVPR